MARPDEKKSARRLLSLLHLLERDSELPLSQVASILGISEREAEKDLAKLSCCGYETTELIPLMVENGVVTIWGELPALDKPIRLSAAEARALVFALDFAGLTADDPLVEKLLDATAVGSPDPVTFERVLRSSSPGRIADVLKQVAVALEDRKVLEIEHQGVGAAEPTLRAIEPLQLVTEDEHWYVEAFCRRAGALRVFRVDRIRSATVTDVRIPRRELILTSRPMSTEGRPRALVRLSPAIDPAELVWAGIEVVAEEPDGSTLVATPFAGTGWIARELVALAGEAEVLEPVEVRDAVRTLAEELSRTT